ncbi:MAG: methyltransferase [Bacilli bacterium]|nr:methyltransferase [Bacilli bacterium]
MELLNKYYLEKDEKLRNELLEEMLENYKVYLDMALSNILSHKELRNNAYLLNVLSRKKRVCDYLKDRFKRVHFDVLVNDEDSKTRKNTYSFMGNFLDKDYVIDLIKLLKKEETNYCISTLVLCLGNYNIKNIEEILNKYMEYLYKKYKEGDLLEVHYNEILTSINKVLNKTSSVINHKFNKLDREVDIYLTCMKPLLNACYTKIKSLVNNARKLEDGVLVTSDEMHRIYKIRCFYEALISMNGFNVKNEDMLSNIKNFLDSKLLENSHTGEGEFTYRIEYVTTKNKQEKINMYNLVNEYIKSNFGEKYLNNASVYEFEIRIIDKGDKCDIFYKLCTFKDSRYDYRIKDLPASINPSSANMMLEEIKQYLKEGAEVLDPFCGTSTMLIERSYLSKCNLTGVDIDSKAIEYSKINSSKANININLVNKDILNHEGFYDEIISNMPYGNRVSNHKENEILYKGFIKKVSSMLNDNGVAILLTTELSLLKKVIKDNKKLKIVKDIYTETGGLTPHLFVIKKI